MQKKKKKTDFFKPQWESHHEKDRATCAAAPEKAQQKATFQRSWESVGSSKCCTWYIQMFIACATTQSPKSFQ